MVRFDRDGIRFATWVGHGRDPEVAYLDATQLVVGSAELRVDGWYLDDTGRTLNTLGGEVAGPIDAAVLHRIAHATLDGKGLPWLRLDGADACGETTELCALARQVSLPAIPYHEPGRFHLDAEIALQWVDWDDGRRLRRAVYADDRYLMEAGRAADGGVRIWPARSLSPFGLELVAPSAEESAEIERRVTQTTALGA